MPSGYTIKSLSASSTEEQIVGVIDDAKRSALRPDRLLALLDHAHIIYKGRSLNEARRIRGYLIESFSHTGLSPRALPYILDELTFSVDAYTIAATAIALRGLKTPFPQLNDYLFPAIRRVRNCDDAISFESYKPVWPLENYTTALLEIFKTFQWMGHVAIPAMERLEELQQDTHFSERVKMEIAQTIVSIKKAPNTKLVDCCTTFPVSKPLQKRVSKSELSKILFQDQEGRVISYSTFFEGRPSLLVFFYTRCENPNRCSLAITRLGKLQQSLQKENLHDKLKIAAVTYDPLFDTSQRMKPYCKHRGFQLDEDNRCLRAVEGMETLLRYITPAVNYNEAIINHHGTELFLVDDAGVIKKRIKGIEWDEATIMADSRALLSKSSTSKSTFRNAWSSFLSVFFSAIVVFFPKCPFCAAAWLSLLGISNMQFFTIKGWLLPILIVLLASNLVALYIMGRRRKSYLPFYLSVLGVMIIAIASLFPVLQQAAYAGMIIMLVASTLNSYPFITSLKHHLNFKINGGSKNRKQTA